MQPSKLPMGLIVNQTSKYVCVYIRVVWYATGEDN